MKHLILATLLAFSGAAMAYDLFEDCHRGHTDGQCDDAKYFTCSVSDGRGNMFTQSSAGFYEQNIVQYRAMKACRNASPVPQSCRPLGCSQDAWP